VQWDEGTLIEKILINLNWLLIRSTLENTNADKCLPLTLQFAVAFHTRSTSGLRLKESTSDRMLWDILQAFMCRKMR